MPYKHPFVTFMSIKLFTPNHYLHTECRVETNQSHGSISLSAVLWSLVFSEFIEITSASNRELKRDHVSV